MAQNGAKPFFFLVLCALLGQELSRAIRFELLVPEIKRIRLLLALGWSPLGHCERGMMLPRIVVVLALRVLVRRKGGLLFLAKRRVTAPLRTNKPLKFPERPQSGLIFKSIYHSEK